MPKITSTCWKAAAIRAVACLFAVLGAFQSGAADARAAINASVQAGAENGFGRIVFRLETPTRVDAALSSGVLVVSFAEPVNLSAGGLAEQLPGYVNAARMDPVGRALRFALERTFRINTMVAGDRVFVDLMPPDWKGPPPEPPADVIRQLSEQAARAEARMRDVVAQVNETKPAAKLAIHVGEQPTFTRLVFDWGAFAPTRLARENGHVRLSFDLEGEIDLARLKADPPRFVKSANAEPTSDGVDLTLGLDDGVEVRGFREGLTYVLDLTGAKAGRAVPTTRTALPRVSGAGFMRSAMMPLPLDGTPDVYGDLRPPVAEKTDQRAEPEKRRAEAKPKKPAPRTIAAQAEKVAGQLRLSFPFEDRVSAAAFRRGRALWLVFDSETEIKLDALMQAGGAWIRTVAKRRIGSMQYVRIDLSKTWLAGAEGGDESWVVTIGDMVGGTAPNLGFVRSLQPNGESTVAVDLPEPGRVHWLSDPEIGDTLAVITAFPPNRSVGKTQDFVDFRALETAHGIAIEPRSDGLAVRLGIDQVRISREGGLNLSESSTQIGPGRKPVEENAAFGAFHADRAAPEQPVNDAANGLLREIAAAKEDERNEKRMRLAELYLGDDLAAEALGILGQVEEKNGGAPNPVSMALRGSANVLMHRPEEALKNLGTHALANDADAALWRGLAYAQQKNWPDALKAFEDGEAAISRYRSEHQARFRLAAARAALETGQTDRAANRLSGLSNAVLSASLAAESMVLNGHRLARTGKPAEALDAYRDAMKSGQPGAAAEAELSEIALARKAGQLDIKTAIDRLERLRLVWRGDDIESGATGALTSLYAEDGNYRAAFGLMKEVVLAFPNAPAAQQVQDRMQTVFQDLYLHGHADRLNPVDSLALYYEFRAMTPVGPLGDEMVRGLADRLMDVDLLDQAAGLLEYQVDKRLKGAARAQVATRLAMVRLMNRQPEAALRVIRRTRQAGLPDDLQLARDLLEARALGELGRIDAAQEMLASLKGPEAERIRGDAYWSAQQWKNAGEQFEKMLGDRWQDTRALSDGERFDAMRAAIAYALAEDRVGVDRLRKKFADKMTGTADAQSFFLVTQAADPSNADFRQLARSIASVDTLDAFMKKYRARYDAPPDPEDRANATETLEGAG